MYNQYDDMVIPRKRAIEILQLIADGKDPMLELHFSAATIKGELRIVYDILNVNDRAHAVAEAMRRKLIE